jgi:hypothetical protein
MTTTGAIAAWEAEGLRLLGTTPTPDERAELRAAAERLALASRARSAPGFDRCASMVCALLAPPELCVVATCSRSMKRVARADHVWRPLTAQRFTCTGDLRRAGSSSLALSGFQEYSRLARIWHHPDRASQPPGMDAYSVVLEIKIGGRRIAGGIYELDVIRDGPWAGEGFGFYDLDPHGRLTPTALESFTDDLITLSICVVRKSDKKCLHLLTDVAVEITEDDYVVFDGYHHISSSSFNNVDGNYKGHHKHATHDFRLHGADAMWDEEESIVRGFTDPYGELTLWDPEASDSLPTETVLKRWHASKNWV